MPSAPDIPSSIEVRGARVHNLQNIDIDVPLQQLVAIAGVSGSGKSSLALGVLYAEGSRRYVEALSTYTRRRMSHAARPAVDSVRYVPAALALRQRPGAPGARSTFGTATELLNVLRIMFSRLGSHVCPNGHRHAPTIDVAAGKLLTCAVCQATFEPAGAEALAFNSGGACSRCEGTGSVRDINDAALVPDETKTIDQGAVAPWNMFGLSVMPQVAAALGVRTDVPYAELTDRERDIVLAGPEVKKHIRAPSKSGKLFDMNFTYRNARRAVEEAMRSASSDRGLARIARFVTSRPCEQCHGTRLSEQARSVHIGTLDLAAATAMTLDDAKTWTETVPDPLPTTMRSMAAMMTESFGHIAHRLQQLGLGYLSLDRASATLSTGERQRVQLARAVRNETTGVLYVLDEPSIGLHPANVEGLLGVMRDLLSGGNSVVIVDHDVQVLRDADWMIEIGPGAGGDGGTIMTSGTIKEIQADPASLIGPFLADHQLPIIGERATSEQMFGCGAMTLKTSALHTVSGLQVAIPKGKLTAVTGVSGSGKTTLVLDSLVPALSDHPPAHIVSVEPAGITQTEVVDATPIGTNVRSTVATYSGVLDDLRRAYATTEEAQERRLTPGDFSYNTGALRCPRCEGTGQIVLDVQFLPDVDIDCPDCKGSRYRPDADQIRLETGLGPLAITDTLALTVRQAREAFEASPALTKTGKKLQALNELGLGYLTLGEATPALSGGEAQRLKLSTQLRKDQSSTLFVLDEPSVGLHPLDTRVLISVLDRLLDHGATVVVIEHDLDLIANADYVIDMGPGGGAAGGHLVASGTPQQITHAPDSITGRYLAQYLSRVV